MTDSVEERRHGNVALFYASPLTPLLRCSENSWLPSLFLLIASQERGIHERVTEGLFQKNLGKLRGLSPSPYPCSLVAEKKVR